jgi:hypothetical protein
MFLTIVLRQTRYIPDWSCRSGPGRHGNYKYWHLPNRARRTKFPPSITATRLELIEPRIAFIKCIGENKVHRVETTPRSTRKPAVSTGRARHDEAWAGAIIYCSCLKLESTFCKLQSNRLQPTRDLTRMETQEANKRQAPSVHRKQRPEKAFAKTKSKLPAHP